MSWMLASSDEFIAVTPSDTALLTYPNDQGDQITRKCKAIFVAATGDITIKNSAGIPVLHTNVLGGGFYAFSTNQIMATGTTANGLVAYF